MLYSLVYRCISLETAQESYWDYSWASLKMEAEKSSEFLVLVYGVIFQNSGKSISINMTSNQYICSSHEWAMLWEVIFQENVCGVGTLRTKNAFSDSHITHSTEHTTSHGWLLPVINPYPTAFPYGNGMVLHFYQQQESSTTKTVHKVINRGLKTYV